MNLSGFQRRSEDRLFYTPLCDKKNPTNQTEHVHEIQYISASS